MPQTINIQISDEPADGDFDDLVSARIMAGCNTTSGWPAVILETPEGSKITLTARNLLGIAGALRGRCIHDGLLELSINPSMALSRIKDEIHLSFEAPVQSAKYDLTEAKKLWRTLREFTQS